MRTLLNTETAFIDAEGMVPSHHFEEKTK